MAEDIAFNKNKHIVNNWDEIYKQSFEFPYTERVGGGTKTFKNEAEFLSFWIQMTRMQVICG